MFIYITRITYSKKLKLDDKRCCVQHAAPVSDKLVVNYLISGYYCQLSAAARVSYVSVDLSQNYIRPLGFDDIVKFRMVNLGLLL
jgi:hypothetical protein